MATAPNAVDTAAGAGRPREFDEDEVLESLVHLFWTKGFESASLSDIVEAAGLNKSSIYNSFGSKQELFYRVLDRYLDQRAGLLDQCSPEGGLDTIVELLEMMRLEITEVMPGRGCLVVNATTELGLREEQAQQVANRYRAMMRGAIEPALRRAAEDGEIAADLVDVYADSFVGLAVSISVASRSGASDDDLNRMVDSIQALVNSWRIA